MLKIGRDPLHLARLTTKSLAQATIREVDHLQALIVASPEPFFQEMGERLLLIGREVKPSEEVGDSIDLLAIDETGSAVIIELKRSENKFQLGQALNYAAMLSTWSADKFLRTRSEFQNEEVAYSEGLIAEHIGLKELDPQERQINKSQRVVLVAEGFDFALLTCAEWLTETYGVNIQCFKIEHVSDDESEYLSCVRIFPARKIKDHSLRIGKRQNGDGTKTKRDLSTPLASITSPSVKSFFSRNYEDAKVNTSRGEISFKLAGTWRLGVSARKQHAYVWQSGRFLGDKEFWESNISDPSRLREVNGNTCLSFSLRTDQDFDFFLRALPELKEKEFFELSDDLPKSHDE